MRDCPRSRTRQQKSTVSIGRFGTSAIQTSQQFPRMRPLLTPRLLQGFLLLLCGFIAGAGCFYACLGKRWREEAGDYCMLRIDSLIIEGEYLHKRDWDTATGAADRGLLGSMYIV